MSNEKQDLINHRLTATTCKNYTDKEIKKAKDELKTFFSKNTVNTEDHTNELAYQITAPAGAKLLQLQAVGGNSVKYEPSVASDDTTALVKTMPSVVYDFDVNKVKGVSVIYNQLISNGNFASSSGWGTYHSSLTILNNVGSFTVTERYGSIGTKVNNIIENHKYLYTCQLKLTTASTEIKFCIRKNSDGNPTIKASSTATTNWQTLSFIQIGDTQYSSMTIIDFRPSDWDEIQVKNVMVFDLTAMGSDTTDVSIATTELLKRGIDINTYQAYDSGSIRNLELSGFKVEGANLVDIPNTTNNTISFTDNIEGTWFGRVWESPYSKLIAPISNKLSNGNYDTTFTLDKDTKIRIQLGQNSVGRWNKDILLKKGTYTISLTFKATSTAVTFSYIMINRGSNALPYVPYISPTTIPIDLTSIVDSSGNKLFADGSLKGNENVQDIITPYYQESAWDKIVFNGSENWSKSTNTNCDRYTLPITINNTANALCNHFTYSKNAVDYTIGLLINNVGTQIIINFATYGTTTLEQFKQWLASNPITLQFERATYLTSNTDLSATLRNIQGHSNGSITAQNTYDMAVPSEIRYNSIIQDTLVDSVSIEGANLANNPKIINNVSSDYNAIILLENLNLPAGTYTISFKNVNTLESGTRYYITTKPDISYIYTGANSSKTDYSLIFTTTATITNLYVRAQYITSGNTGITSDIMLNYGSIVLPYRPYKETITRLLPNSEAKYGWGINADVHNLRVFSDYEGNEVNKGSLAVGNQDLGSLNWAYDHPFSRMVATLVDCKTASPRTLGFICIKYQTINDGREVTDVPNNSIYNGFEGTNALVFVRDDNFKKNSTIFKSAMSGVPLYYELDNTSKTETDIDDFDYFFDVEEGDTITFNNAYAQQVYATYSFIIKEVKSNE